MEPHVVWADDPALPSGGSLTAFHGTDIESARILLRGEPLNVEKAAAHKIDGPPGFFPATEVDDAMFFALRRAPGGVLACHLSLYAVEQLQAAGMRRRQIPPGRLSGSLVMRLSFLPKHSRCSMGYERQGKSSSRQAL